MQKVSRKIGLNNLYDRATAPLARSVYYYNHLPPLPAWQQFVSHPSLRNITLPPTPSSVLIGCTPPLPKYYWCTSPLPDKMIPKKNGPKNVPKKQSKKQFSPYFTLGPRQNFSLQYQYNIKQTSDEDEEKYRQGDY